MARNPAKARYSSKSHRDAERRAFEAVNIHRPCDVPGCARLRHQRRRYCVLHGRHSTLYGHPEAGPLISTKYDRMEFDVHRKRIRMFLEAHRGTPQVQAAEQVMSNLINFGIESGYHRSLPGAPPATEAAEKITVSRPRSRTDTTFNMADEELRRLRRHEVDPIRALEVVLTVHRFVRDNRRGSIFNRDHTVLKCAMAGELFKMVRQRRLNGGRNYYPPASGTARRVVSDVIQALLGVFFINVLNAIDHEEHAAMEAKQTLATPFATADDASAD